MKAIMLALHDYRWHTTDEGWQLQEGLRRAGVELWGKGYPAPCNELNIPKILDAAQPDVVIVSDPRDWTAAQRGAWDEEAEFWEPEALRDVPTVVVFKDAATSMKFQRAFHARTNADALLCYYHPRSVCAVAPWVEPERIIRAYHTIDAEAIPKFGRERKGAIVSGARNHQVYPAREDVCSHAKEWGVDVLPHPGYGNHGTHVRQYYETLNRYKVSIATASKYAFALRKIVEGIACGCAVISDLPAYDELPAIDLAVTGAGNWPDTIKEAQRLWSPAIAQQWADIAKRRYHYPTECKRLYAEIERRFNA